MTTVKLLNVPFESNYKDTVWFEGESAQVSYFNGKVVKTFTDFSYQRKDNIIRVPAHVDTLYNCNYVMYQNSNISNKWFYAFIVDMKFVNDERTDITIETDVMQTWAFDYTVKTSFVEREHVIDDTPGLHTVPEQVETGEYVCDAEFHKNTLKYKGIVVGATINLAEKVNDIIDGKVDKFDNVGGAMYHGIYSGIRYYYFPADSTIVNDIFKTVADEGQSDGIVSVFMAPTNLLDITYSGSGEGQLLNRQVGVIDVNKSFKEIPWEEAVLGGESDVAPSKPTTFGSHTVRNKKLLTFPYCYLLGSNNAGGTNVYRYELFPSNKLDFKILSSLTPGMSIRLVPVNYNGVPTNNLEGLNLGKFPVCAWTTDVYTNWLTQNSVNIGMDIASTGLSIVGGALGVATGVGAGLGTAGIVSGVMGIGNTIGQVYQHSLTPPAVNGNLNSGDVSFSSGLLTFTLYKMRIKEEYAKIIDEYFDMFGYKVNRVKVPNQAHKRGYWFTKTIDVNIDGAIPNKDLDKIKENYNKGITFWRRDVTMGDYTSNYEELPG